MLPQYYPRRIENRSGDARYPFGFVYISTSKNGPEYRVGFGATRENPDPLAVWPCSWTPDDMGAGSVERVRQALRREYSALIVKETA